MADTFVYMRAAFEDYFNVTIPDGTLRRGLRRSYGGYYHDKMTTTTTAVTTAATAADISTTATATTLGAISLAWLVLGFTFLVHWVACINFMVGDQMANTTNGSSPLSTTHRITHRLAHPLDLSHL